MSLLRKWQTEENDAYVVSLVRAILGVLLFLSALRELDAFRRDAHFADVFHLPIVPEALVPGRGVFTALGLLQLALAALVVIGRGGRPSLLATAVIGLFLLLCDRLAYHNNRYALLLFAFLLAFAPCDRAFVWRKRAATPLDRTGPLWAARLAQVQLSIIYLASGGSKLLDPDWREGRVIGDRLLRTTSLAVARGVPPALMELLSNSAFASALAKLAIFTELFLAVGLFLRRTRPFALWWGVMFHLTIEVTSQVELFSWLSIAVYALFAVPTLRERVILYDPGRPWGGFVARLVRRLDWLARFDIRADATAAAGHGFVIVERDGSRAAGLLGVARIARATPLFFPLSVPLLVLARVFTSGRGRPRRRMLGVDPMVEATETTKGRALSILFGAVDIVSVIIVYLAVFAGLPARYWLIDGCAALLMTLFAGAGIGLLAGTAWAPRAALVASVVSLVLGLVLVSTLALAASYLSGIYGPVGRGGALILTLAAALTLPYLVAIPLAQIAWLGRGRWPRAGAQATPAAAPGS